MKQGFVHEGSRPKLTSIKKHAPRGNQRFQQLPQPSGDSPYHLQWNVIWRDLFGFTLCSIGIIFFPYSFDSSISSLTHFESFDH
jgi:hypothetical protein